MHITCALFSDLYEIADFENMTITASPKTEKRVPKQNKHCDFCAKSLNLFKCSTPECDSHTHIQCALNDRNNYLIEDEESLGGYVIRLFRDNNPIKVTFDPNEQSIQESIKNFYLKAQEMVSAKPSEEQMQIESEQGSKRKKGGDKKKGKKAQPTATQKPEAQEYILTEDDEEFLKELNSEFQENVTDELKDIPPSSYIRGGKMILECPAHRSVEQYCICNLPYDQTRFMVGCDCCGKI